MTHHHVSYWLNQLSTEPLSQSHKHLPSQSLKRWVIIKVNQIVNDSVTHSQWVIKSVRVDSQPLTVPAHAVRQAATELVANNSLSY